MADILFESTANVTITTNSPTLYIWGELNSVIVSQTSTPDSEIHVNILLNSNINGSVFGNEDADLDLENRFESIAAGIFTTNIPTFNIIGTSNIPIAPKKIQYIVDNLIGDSIDFQFPKYKELIRSYLKFLDLTSIKTTLNILNNNNINTVYDEYVDSYLENLFNGVIDLNKYGLTNANKKRFLQLSRILNNLKGNRKSFDFLFRTFTNIQVAQDDIQLDIDKIVVDYLEDESWWLPTIANFYDGSIDYDGSNTHGTDFQRPFTYQFLIDQSRETMLPLIRTVHPAGFNYEFLLQAVFEDEQEMSDEIEMSTRYFHYYAYGEPDMTWYTYNGAITYSPYHDVPLIF